MTDDNGGADKEIDNARERAWKLEQELAQILHQHNEETRGLHKEIAKSRSSLEQCEAEKQKLEYILFAAKQEMCKLEESGLEREQQLGEITEALQSRISQLTRQSQEWNNTLDTMQQSRTQERLESQRIIAAKEEQLTNATNRNRELEAELENLRSSLMSHVGSLEQLQGKLTALEVECEEKTAAVLQQGRELQQANQQERHLMEQLQEKTKEVKSLEESIQAEKAAHLDCKFTAEIAQLRLKELECKTEADKNFILEISATLEQANENISKLQHEVDKENHKVIELSDKLMNKELEYSKLEQRTQEQLKEKDVLHNTSLQQAQQKIKLLQNKLDHSSQRESDMKDQLISIKNDLLVLLSTVGGRGYSAEATPTNLLQLLKNLIPQQHAKIKEQNQKQLRIANENQEQLRAECMRYKEVLESRSSAVTEAEQKLAQYSNQLSQLQEEMTKITSSHNEKCQKLQMQLGSTASQRNAENESHCRYLQNLYNQMTSCNLGSHDTTQQTELSNFMNKPPSNDWAHLSSLVAKETATICDRLKNLASEVSNLETSCEQLKDQLVTEQQSHQQDVDQLSLQQVHQLEQCDKYQRQTEALCAEIKNLQASCYDNTNQISQLTEANQTLTEEHAQCRAVVRQLSTEKCLLVPALAMLVGTIFPLLARQHQLILQKAVLSRQLQQSEKLQNCVVELTELLESVSDQAPPSRRCPLMRFRKIVLVVLATNRMMLLHRHSNCLLVGDLSSPVVTKVTMHSGECTGVQWLNNHTLMDDIIQSLSNMKLNQWDPPVIKGYYCQLLGQLSKHFTSTTIAMDCWSHTSYPFSVATNNQSLWQHLTHATSQRNSTSRNNPEQLSELLRSQLLTLTAKLHDGELDRHNLHQQLLEANQNCQQLSIACNDALTMATTVEKLQHEIQLMVPAEQYDEVNNLLQLSRQQHSEQEDVVSCHVNHIQQLDQRLVRTLAELKQSEESLTKATLELHQLKEQTVIQEQQLKDVSLQCRNLQQQLARVQHSLTTVISEQQALEQIMTMATEAFKQSQRDIDKPMTSSHQLQPLLDMLTDEQSKLVANSNSSCQEMIKQLLSAHQASLELITSLRAQLDSYRVHTNALKGELSAACRRQLTSMAASLDYQEDEMSLDNSNSQIATQGALLGVSMAKSLNMMQQD